MINNSFDGILTRTLDENRRLPFGEAVKLAQEQYALVVKACNESSNPKAIEVPIAAAKPALPEVASQKEDQEKDTSSGSKGKGESPRNVIQLVYEQFLADHDLLKPTEDTITCGFCGKKMKNITRHIDSAHGVKPIIYKKIFNLPDDMRLDSIKSKEMAEKRGAKMKGKKRNKPVPTDGAATDGQETETSLQTPLDSPVEHGKDTAAVQNPESEDKTDAPAQ
jgi:hypothetical protein